MISVDVIYFVFLDLQVMPAIMEKIDGIYFVMITVDLFFLFLSGLTSLVGRNAENWWHFNVDDECRPGLFLVVFAATVISGKFSSLGFCWRLMMNIDLTLICFFPGTQVFPAIIEKINGI